MKLIERKPLSEKFERWDIEVENHSNFIVSGAVVHNSNVRVGLVDGVWMAGSHEKRRKPPVVRRKGFMGLLERIRILKPLPLLARLDAMKRNPYWFPFTIENVRDMITSLSAKHRQVVVFGETYGRSVQKGYSYDLNGQDEIGFRVFDILLDGKYLPWDTVKGYCLTEFHVDIVPELKVGSFSMEEIKALAEGNTTLGEHIREGVVVRPFDVERKDPEVGRVILKYVGDTYLASKSKDEEMKDV